MEFPKFAIGIPTLNRWDLLRTSLWRYLQDFPTTQIFVLDNGRQDKEIRHPRIKYIDQQSNIGVAAGWNVLCKAIFTDVQYALILNDDIYLGRSEYQVGNLLNYEKGNFFIAPTDWCAFIMPKPTFNQVGPFDENFLCYYEDKDYERRLKLSSLGFVRWHALFPTIYRKNSSSDKNPNVLKWSRDSLKYYIKKWGGPPGGEKFSQPFNINE